MQPASFDPSVNRACCYSDKRASVFHAEHGDWRFALVAPKANSALLSPNQNDFVLLDNHLDLPPARQSPTSTVV